MLYIHESLLIMMINPCVDGWDDMITIWITCFKFNIEL